MPFYAALALLSVFLALPLGATCLTWGPTVHLEWAPSTGNPDGYLLRIGDQEWVTTGTDIRVPVPPCQQLTAVVVPFRAGVEGPASLPSDPFYPMHRGDGDFQCVRTWLASKVGLSTLPPDCL